MTHFAENFLKADHEFKFGLELSHGSGEGLDGIPGGVSYYDYEGMPYTAYFSDTSVTGSQATGFGVFAEDRRSGR